jgi:hypothetical protein
MFRQPSSHLVYKIPFISRGILLYLKHVDYFGLIKPGETLGKISKSFMFDQQLGESLQEKLLSEPISSQPGSSASTDFILKETNDDELLNNPLEDGFLDDAQLPQMLDQSEIEAFVTTLWTVGEADLKDFSHLRNCNLENSRYGKVFDQIGNEKSIQKRNSCLVVTGQITQI